MELKQLRYFIELSKTLNFSRAAENLYVTQPALSQQISALEDELKVRLFNRTHRKTELTPAGKAYLERCVQAMALLDEGANEARAIGQSGPGETTLVIGVDESTSYLDKNGFFTLQNRFQKEYPDHICTLRFLPWKTIENGLVSHEIDLAVSIMVPEELEHTPFATAVIHKQSIILCVPHSFYINYQDDSEECVRKAAEELEMCLFEDDKRWENNFKRIFHDLGLPFHPLYLNDYHTVRTCVQSGRGAMLDVELSISAEMLSFCTPLKLPSAQADASDVLLWDRENQKPGLALFLELMRREEQAEK